MVAAPKLQVGLELHLAIVATITKLVLNQLSYLLCTTLYLFSIDLAMKHAYSIPPNHVR